MVEKTSDRNQMRESLQLDIFHWLEWKITFLSILFADKVTWIDVREIPLLAFDHNHIVESGLDFLKHELNHELTSELLPRKFTLSQLQELHEIVLNQKFDKRNFRKTSHQ